MKLRNVRSGKDLAVSNPMFFFGHDRELALREGDLLAVLSAGAYGMAMASNYNTRPRAAEVMVDGGQAHLIRRRESVAELFTLESALP